jgi:hypothetical protein
MDDIVLKYWIEYWLSIYFCMWIYLCFFPFIRLFYSEVLKNVSIHIRPIFPYSYTIIGNHYDLDDWDDLYGGRSSSSSDVSDEQVAPSRTLSSPIIIRVWTLDLRCKANEYWHIICDGSGRYHIGLVIEVYDIYAENVFSSDILVPVSVFYRFPIESAKQYLLDLVDSSEEFPGIVLAAEIGHNIRVDGLRDLSFSDDSAWSGGFVIKTYWIRIIQRRWKRVYSEKMRLIRLRGGLRAQRNFEISGKYGIDVGTGLGLRGLLFVESQQI